MDKEISYRESLERSLPDGLYEIELCGHPVLAGKKADIDWMVREKTICEVINKLNKEYDG